MLNQPLILNSMPIPVGNIESYLHRISQFPLLTLSEEVNFANDYRENGNLKAAQQLVLAHLRYVGYVAKGYLGYGLPLADLVQEGNIGLMKAVKRFDPTIGVRLVSFAVHWIKAEIHEYIIRNWRIVKIATTKAQRKLFFNLRKAKKRLGWFNQDDINTIAADLNVPPQEVIRMEERLNSRDVAFELPSVKDSSNALIPADYLNDETANPEYQYQLENEEACAQSNLQVAMAKLDARSQDIVQKRWLLEDKKATLQELATTHQVSMERIRQLEQNALAKLKKWVIQA